MGRSWKHGKRGFQAKETMKMMKMSILWVSIKNSKQLRAWDI